MKKVVKFGGSSLASAEQFKKVGDIIRSDGTRRYVVPSAPGKRFSQDTKVTDLLYACYRAVGDEKKFQQIFAEIKGRYQEIIDGLELDFSLEEDFAVVEENFKKQIGIEYAASRGEFLNGKIMAAYLGYEFVDPAEIIRFDGNGQFDAGITELLAAKRLKDLDTAVIPGFYGAKENGEIKTFSRGGSDVTGSIIAGALDVELYENWTDVSGFMVTDPRIIDNPKSIDTITYRELRELS